MSGLTATPEQNRSLKSGYLFGAAAYLMWGLFPAFFPLLEPAGALEILAHRMLWTLLLMAVVVVVSRRLRDLVAMGLRNWGLLTGASLLIALNWGVYIYAVNSGHVLTPPWGITSIRW